MVPVTVLASDVGFKWALKNVSRVNPTVTHLDVSIRFQLDPNTIIFYDLFQVPVSERLDQRTQIYCASTVFTKPLNHFPI